MKENLFTRKNSCAKYFCIPSTNKPRIIVPLYNKKVYKQGWTIHNTATTINKIIVKALRSSYHVIKICGINILFRDTELEELLQFFKNKISFNIVELAVYCGSNGSKNEKYTMLLLDSNGTILGVMKYPLAIDSKKYIEKEYEALFKLSQLNLNYLTYPLSVCLIKWKENNILYQQYIFNKTSAIPNRLNIDIVNASIELAKATLPFCLKSRYNHKIRTSLNNIKISKKIIDKVVNSIDAVINAQVPVIWVHGDYVVYNLRSYYDKICVVDWEYAHEGYPLYDIFHFIFQGQYQVNKCKIKKIMVKLFEKKNTEYFNYYLKSLNIDINILSDILILYLVDALSYDLAVRDQGEIYNNQYYLALEALA